MLHCARSFITIMLHVLNCVTRVQKMDEPLAIGSMWAFLDLVEEEDFMNRLEKMEEKVSPFGCLLCTHCVIRELVENVFNDEGLQVYFACYITSL